MLSYGSCDPACAISQKTVMETDVCRAGRVDVN